MENTARDEIRVCPDGNHSCHPLFKIGRNWLLAGLLALTLSAQASDDLLIFTDFTDTLYGATIFNNGWKDKGSGTRFVTNSPTHSGTLAYALTPTKGNQSIYFSHDAMDASLYASLTFWINGGASGGQSVAVNGTLDGVDQPKVTIGINGKLPTNAWLQVTLSMAALGCANKTNFDGIRIWSNSNNVQPQFIVDDVLLVAAAPPALVHVGVNAAQSVRTVDPRLFGVNAAAWDGLLETTNTLSVLGDMNNQVLRWPGGSWGDLYHWTNEPWMTGATAARNWGSFSPNFIRVATNSGAQVFIICNYGSSTPEEAAWGVRMFNVTNRCAFKYWEVGNEIYGNWEQDDNTNLAYFGQQVAHDPWTYAMRFKDYYAQMKAVDPTIKIGAVVVPDEDASANNSNHPAVNPVTGTTHNGWTAVLLNTFRTNGVTPDFLVEHNYPPPANGDAYNLMNWTKTWADDAATLRRLLNNYLGSNVASHVELVSTEFGPRNGKQWISLVGGLGYADTVGQVLQTEFNSLLWWNMRGGGNVISNSDNALYGWRTNSDGYFVSGGGCVDGNAIPPNRYPGFYCMKLMQYFARGGDTVVTVTNDFQLLSTYAVKRTNGTLTLLAINKSSVSNLTAAVNIAGYLPLTNAAVYSYGIPQDDAARTGIGSMDVFQTNYLRAGTRFTNTFAPYSATVMVFTQLNTPPVANPDSYSVSANTTNIFSPLLNDMVVTPGGSLSLVSVSATNGVASISGTNVVFAPSQNFAGTATIGYVITDNLGGTNQSLITVSVYPVGTNSTVLAFTNSATWICPAGVTSVQVYGWGGGGGSGGSTITASGTLGAGGGGGGAFAAATVAVTPGNAYNVTVGAGGAAGTAGVAGNAGAGGASWFGIAAAITNVLAAGGVGGSNASGASGNGGAGGASTACIGTITFGGGNGSNGGGSAGGGGGSAGGGGAGSNGAITAGGTNGAAGNGLPAGAVGGNGASGAGPGNAGSFPGGGAGGAKANTTAAGAGAAGGGGELVLVYTSLPAAGTNLAYFVNGSQMTLQWPASYIGWLLQSNTIDLANTNYWFTVPGSVATNQVIINLDATKAKVFYRMAHP